MKKGEKVNKKVNNRVLYTFIFVVVLVSVIGGIYAVDTSQAYHSANQIDFAGATIPQSMPFVKDAGISWGNLGAGAGDTSSIYSTFTGAENQFLILKTTNDADATNGDHILLLPSGNVGIGTSDIFAPSAKLEVRGNILSSGTVTATSFIYSSDRILKEDIQPLTNVLDKVKQLQGVSFSWKSDGREDIGVIAQDVEKVFPELVYTDKEGLKSVEYGNLVAVLIEAVKEQQRQIDELKEKCR